MTMEPDTRIEPDTPPVPEPEPPAVPADAVPVAIRHAEDVRYLDEAHSRISASFEMSDGGTEMRAVLLSDDTAYARILGDWIAAGNAPAPWVYSPDLDAYRRTVKAQVDLDAERARLKYVTPGAVQAAIYVAKEAEALRYLADPAPMPDAYPLLAASIEVDGDDLRAVAARITATAAAWRQVAAAIERVRLKAKRAIDEAASRTGVARVRRDIVWP